VNTCFGVFCNMFRYYVIISYFLRIKYYLILKYLINSWYIADKKIRQCPFKYQNIHILLFHLRAIFSEPGSSSQHGKPFLLKGNFIYYSYHKPTSPLMMGRLHYKRGWFLAHLSTKCSVSFCDRSMSGVRRPSVRASVNNFFKQYLWNRLFDFDQTSQEWSLGGPLSKLFKPFQLVA